MLDFLMTERHLSKEDAYMLVSAAGDLHHQDGEFQRGRACDAARGDLSLTGV
jgi:hypothetical protein